MAIQGFCKSKNRRIPDGKVCNYCFKRKCPNLIIHLINNGHNGNGSNGKIKAKAKKELKNNIKQSL